MIVAQTYFSAAPFLFKNPQRTYSFPIAHAKGRTNGRTFWHRNLRSTSSKNVAYITSSVAFQRTWRRIIIRLSSSAHWRLL